MAVDSAARQRRALVARARAKHERMKQMQAERDDAIRGAVAAGVTLRQISRAVGLSHQRIAQIASGSRELAAG
jgi:transcriptional regulator with XRE-family HTH domain